MGSDWIDVGSALIRQDTITAVCELSFDKYNEKWSFCVRTHNTPNNSGNINISNKDESYIRKEHTALKQVLRNS